eukprot:6175352-Amphidinium_carterae.1
MQMTAVHPRKCCDHPLQERPAHARRAKSPKAVYFVFFFQKLTLLPPSSQFGRWLFVEIDPHGESHWPDDWALATVVCRVGVCVRQIRTPNPSPVKAAAATAAVKPTPRATVAGARVLIKDS